MRYLLTNDTSLVLRREACRRNWSRHTNRTHHKISSVNLARYRVAKIFCELSHAICAYRRHKRHCGNSYVIPNDYQMKLAWQHTVDFPKPVIHQRPLTFRISPPHGGTNCVCAQTLRCVAVVVDRIEQA